MLAKDEDDEVHNAVAEDLPYCCKQGGLKLSWEILELLAVLVKDQESEVREEAADGFPACCVQSASLELAGQVMELPGTLVEDRNSDIWHAAANGLPACPSPPQCVALVECLRLRVSLESLKSFDFDIGGAGAIALLAGGGLPPETCPRRRGFKNAVVLFILYHCTYDVSLTCQFEYRQNDLAHV